MTLTTQFMTMASMIGMGALFGAMLDTYQRFLQRSKRKHWLVFINDILFWIIQALVIFYVLFLVNRGEFRFYILLALICGFAAYQSLIKRIYLRLLEWMILFVVHTANIIRQVLSLLVVKPVIGLFQLAMFTILFIGRGLFTLVKFIFKIVLLSIKFLSKPIRLILLKIWKVLPKRFKKNVETFYNKTAGFFSKIKNYIRKCVNWWKKRKK
ncbi:spore cortex biosynthesis protein YabQ [Neobacillus sp. SM06]|uniref:spore cortex biosynthesis protein YabQ n=1 Tax=Neobacillus sp. SM06 TaxID=3422492 RepID=UPI003D29D8C1